MMESIEKLREWSHQYDNGWIQEDGSIILAMNTHGVYYGENHGDAIRKMIDAVEREVDEKYIALPLDADGVPIRLHDKMDDMEGATFHAESIHFTSGNWGCDSWWVNEARFDPRELRHAKPRTIEDVLRELIATTRKERIVGSKVSDETIAEYADELRKLGGDA